MKHTNSSAHCSQFQIIISMAKCKYFSGFSKWVFSILLHLFLLSHRSSSCIRVKMHRLSKSWLLTSIHRTHNESTHYCTKASAAVMWMQVNIQHTKNTFVYSICRFSGCLIKNLPTHIAQKKVFFFHFLINCFMFVTIANLTNYRV